MVFLATTAFFIFPFLLVKGGRGRHWQTRLLIVILLVQAFSRLALAIFFQTLQRISKNHPDAMLMFVATSHLAVRILPRSLREGGVDNISRIRLPLT